MVKIDLITGFLGSGKTTFIKKYAKYLIDSGKNIGILENDYGAVNVDMMLLQDLMGDQCELEMVSGGCDKDCHRRRFKTKLIAMGMCGYDRVIVEPSGIYDVDEFFDVLRDDPIDRWYEIGNVITVACPSWPPAWSLSSWGRTITPWRSPVSTPWPVVRRSACGSCGGSTSSSTRPARWPRSCASPPAAGRALSRTSSAAPAAPPPTFTWSRAGLGWPFCPRRTSAPIPSPVSRRSSWRSGSSRRWGWPGAGTRPPPWWTPQSSSPGSGSNDRPLLFLFSPCPSCCIIEPFH